MKKLITLLSVITAGFALSPMSADARPSHSHSRPASVVYVSGYASCGSPIYMKKVFSHYDRYGRAVYTYHRHVVTRRDHRRPAISYYNGRRGGNRVALHTPFGSVRIRR